ncbi:MAG: pantetheine-phosphate adenylyltransferase [Chitinophagales bacterium]|nr:pantetheine-phosphate adenylyltransferase [Bacteroidota bacterium]MCB9257362.1 pantetheine-phosphate adenylyltransferase [Chitinophagales bacterium]
MKAKIAVFPGSFDPITIGHVDIVKRALPLFDKIIVAIGINSQKKSLYSLKHRMDCLNLVFKDMPEVETDFYEGLTINYCKQKSASYILRGIRSASDFEYEKTIAHLNNAMDEEVETILILSKPELSSISSTIVREIIKGKGEVSKFVPKEVLTSLYDFEV